MVLAYPDLAVEEAFFINHGYLPNTVAHAIWSHPPEGDFLVEHADQIKQILKFGKRHGDIDAAALNHYLGNTNAVNAWGGTGQEGSQIMQRMHARGLLRIARRSKGARVYALPRHQPGRLSADQIITTALATLAKTYAPFTKTSLATMGRLFTHGRSELKPTLKKAMSELDLHFASTQIDGQIWYWPKDEAFERALAPQHERVQFLAPFDPLVWDRERFKQFWGWDYKFEAYKPASARQFGYYAMPVLWQGECVGWANIAAEMGDLSVSLGYASKKPGGAAFKRELEQEIDRLRMFLGTGPNAPEA